MPNAFGWTEIYSIGYENLDPNTLLDILKKHNINYLIDITSHDAISSFYKSNFNENILKLLEIKKINYINLHKNFSLRNSKLKEVYSLKGTKIKIPFFCENYNEDKFIEGISIIKTLAKSPNNICIISKANFLYDSARFWYVGYYLGIELTKIEVEIGEKGSIIQDFSYIFLDITNPNYEINTLADFFGDEGFIDWKYSEVINVAKFVENVKHNKLNFSKEASYFWKNYFDAAPGTMFFNNLSYRYYLKWEQMFGNILVYSGGEVI